MAPPGGPQGGGTKDESAKHFLDKIGQQVHEQVEKEAETYKNKLKGDLKEAKGMGETASSLDPCILVDDYRNKVKRTAAALGDPCKKDGKGEEEVKRFSDKEGAECNKSKIKDSKTNCGACAPYRRLHVCNKNFQNINNDDSSKAKHDLLADVCLAAKFEGQSIKTHHPQHKETNPDSQLCTELARSFADIGDIIRGKDLYLGNKKKNQTERDQLESKLKDIFAKIHNGLDGEAQARYKGDTDGNYYKLREDWWTANRHTVWKAITCGAPKESKYFRQTCNYEETLSDANHKCRCKDKKGEHETDQVPTYFDYVPQYLRWFEEWAEDFCRKKKKYVDIVKTYCRGKYQGKDRYCSRNGYDCERTIYKKGYFVIDKGCINCLYACNPYVDWIENQRKQFLKQKEQFDKQKNKYDKEIKKYESGASGSGNGRAKRSVSTKVYDGYEKKFYDKLNKSEYRSVDDFLELLSKEAACKEVQDTEGGRINFKEVNSGSASVPGGDGGGTSGTNVESQGTFYRSEYCQPCPDCGVKKKSDSSGWEQKNGGKCKSGNLYKPKHGVVGTTITILKSGEGKEEIEKKLEAFCDGKNGESLYDPWKCYKGEDVEKVKNKDEKEDEDDIGDYENIQNAGGLCILENNDGEGKVNKQKTFNPFFYYWVAHMLKDSIHWRTKKIKGCLKNEKKKCGNPKCEKSCKCFETWIKQKETEWTNIKKHFYTQKITGKQGGMVNGAFLDGLLTHDFVLQENLKEEFLKGDSTEDKQNSLDAEEIKHLREMLQETGFDGAAAGGSSSGGVTEQKNIMDKLIEHEEGIAETCKKCPKKPQQEVTRLRSETNEENATPRPAEEEEEEDDEDDDDAEEEEDEVQEVKTEVTEQGEDNTEKEVPATTEEEKGPQVPVKEDKLDVCTTVKKALAEDNLTQACQQKYEYGREKFPNWKCISDTTTSGVVTTTTSGATTGGSICIPPRRRRLYVGKLTEWASGGNTQVTPQASGGEPQTQTSGKETPSDKLRTAFIQSAAVETFFLWHKYKADKAREDKEKKEANGDLFQRETSADTEQKDLEEGKIDDEFKRQMFYTLGDYRDILFGDTSIVEAAAGSEQKEAMQKIKQKIQEHIKTDIKTSTSSHMPVQPEQSSDKKLRENWWTTHGKYIWQGMLCALSYDTDSKQIKQDVQDKLVGSNSGNKYDYTNVSFSGGFNSDKKTTATITKLEEFSRRPQYFRWLEEWGEEFCRKQRHKLYIIEKECKVEANGRGGNEKKPKCSCYGENCKDQLPDDPSTDADLKCPRCGKHCRSYKKWIERKRKEFEKQKERYQKESDSAKRHKDNNPFYNTLDTCSKAKDFLQKLGSCSKKDSESGQDEIKFDDEGKTFGHETYCKPCSKFKINCKENGNCNGGEKRCNSKKGNDYITAKNIGNGVNSTVIDMLVSDNSTTEFAADLKDACENAHIFKGIRKDQWECRNVCGYVVCKSENGNGRENQNKIITIRALVTHWVQNFLDDYNKIRKKLMQCMNSGEGSACIKGCVDKWVQQKKGEWEEIKKHYLKQNEELHKEIKSLFRNFLGDVQPQTDVKKATGREKISDFESSCHCNGSASSESGKDGTQKDIVECLLDKLGEKATSCQKQHSGEQTNCVQSSPLPDDEDLLLEETENQVAQPNICPTTQAEPEAEVEGGCKPAEAAPKESAAKPADSDETPDQVPESQTPKAPELPAKPAAPPAAPPQRPRRPRRTLELLDNPHVKTALMSSTIMWSIGIGFATFTYFFLKKKSKSSVGNLFQILQIPQNDYGIPTLKSSNRYIPYGTDKYRGKRYIYIEGDSGTDSGYTDHYSDITSSESEYEELDINDIYVPGSPKYKTLIEVVLEPSKRDTQNDIHNDIPSDIPNTPSDTPPPITDDEWNQLKKDFISNMLQNTQNTEPNILRDNVDNNTHPTMSRHKVDQKPFIMSIHDRNLYIGEEYSYDMSTNSGQNNVYSGIDPTSANHDSYSDKNDPISDNHHPYSGIDLINDVLNGDYDIYDEILKRKENELFGTYHTKKNTSTNSVAKNTNSDPILNQINLFHKWLDRHRYMCAKLKNKEDILNKLKEEWNKENNNNSAKTYNSDNKSSHNHVLNTDVSIQIDMNNPKPKNEFTNMDTSPDKSTIDTILDDLEKYNEPYYYDFYKDDIIYHDVDVEKSSMDDIYVDHNNVTSNNMDVPTKMHIEMNIVNNKKKIFEEEYPISDIWNI
ncbi:hypothetical protein C923_00834 [Plasmodium falciparum UGT5.1]|uniref:Erythrocyte membrane protein 1 n=1 Tax=Plasmodium falciparum UGT5.1 TaxID=1237627 RepID=W7JU95_PLAFA|nr:hypothetical protein C923_00834 [Plasmodium falciparum UGT5.1]